MRIERHLKCKIKDRIAKISPEVYEYFGEDMSPFELMIYTKDYHNLNNPNEFDLEDFSKFDGTMTDLDKQVNIIRKNYGNSLSHIDFKWSEVEGDFDQITIFKK